MLKVFVMVPRDFFVVKLLKHKKVWEAVRPKNTKDLYPSKLLRPPSGFSGTKEDEESESKSTGNARSSEAISKPFSWIENQGRERQGILQYEEDDHSRMRLVPCGI